jgi:hypothetical protein
VGVVLAPWRGLTRANVHAQADTSEGLGERRLVELNRLAGRSSPDLHNGLEITMTTTPQEPAEDPDLVPSGDPTINPDVTPDVDPGQDEPSEHPE